MEIFKSIVSWQRCCPEPAKLLEKYSYKCCENIKRSFHFFFVSFFFILGSEENYWFSSPDYLKKKNWYLRVNLLWTTEDTFWIYKMEIMRPWWRSCTTRILILVFVLCVKTREAIPVTTLSDNNAMVSLIFIFLINLNIYSK